MIWANVPSKAKKIITVNTAIPQGKEINLGRMRNLID